MSKVEMMMDEVIRVRGFEDYMTIWFCKLVEENVPLETLEYAKSRILNMGFEN